MTQTGGLRDASSGPLVGKLAGRRILVTGGSGFLGSRLVERLGRGAAQVYAVSRQAYVGRQGDVTWLEADLKERTTSRRLLEAVAPHVVFHLAGTSAAARDLELLQPTFENNVMATVNVLEAAAAVGCARVVAVGSMEEAEVGEPGAIPSSPYAASKAAAAVYMRMFSGLYRLPVVEARVFMTYGPGQRSERKLVPYVMLCVLEGRRPALTSGLRPVDWVYVDDVVDALLVLATAEGVEGSTCDIGSGSLVTVRTVVEWLFEMAGSPELAAFGALPDRPLEGARVADVEATFRKIGWRATTSLEAGLNATVRWYREHWQQLRTGASLLVLFGALA